MPLTNAEARIVDPVLTTVAQGYASQEFVGESLFPTVYTPASGGQIIEFDRAAFQLYNTRRAAGANTAEIQVGYKGKPYVVQNHRLLGVLPREHKRDALVVAGLNLEMSIVDTTMRALELGMEVDRATLATTLANYPALNRVTLAGATKWSAATGAPLADVDAGREVIRQACGMYPNTMVLSPLAFNACKNNPNIVARFQYNGMAGTDASAITERMLAGLFRVKNVIVGAGVYWTDAGQGVDIWGNNVVMAFVPETAKQMRSPYVPSYGYTYTLEGHPYVEQSYEDKDKASQKQPVTLERVAVLSGISCGYLIQAPA